MTHTHTHTHARTHARTHAHTHTHTHTHTHNINTKYFKYKDTKSSSTYLHGVLTGCNGTSDLSIFYPFQWWQKSFGSTCNEVVTKKMSGDADPHPKYRSPLSARYASAEISYNFSEQKTFFIHGENCGLGWRRQKRWAILYTLSLIQLEWRRPQSCHQCH